MHKIILLILILVSGVAKESYSQNVTLGSVLDSNGKTIIHYYMASDSTGIYWGAHELMIAPGREFYSIDADGFTISAVKLAQANDSIFLTNIFTMLMLKNRSNGKANFQKILLSYKRNKDDPDWIKKVREELNLL